MKLTRSVFLIVLTLFLVLVMAGCKTQPTIIPPDLSAAESFQRAQDASDNGDYMLAIKYYSAYRDNNPTSKDRNAWALYEIAFNYHKMGKNAVAITYLDQVLQEYQADTGTLPAAPRILAQKLKDRLSPTVAPAIAAQPPAAKPAGAPPSADPAAAPLAPPSTPAK